MFMNYQILHLRWWKVTSASDHRVFKGNSFIWKLFLFVERMGRRLMYLLKNILSQIISEENLFAAAKVFLYYARWKKPKDPVTSIRYLILKIKGLNSDFIHLPSFY